MGRVCAPALTFLFFTNRLRIPLARGRAMIASPPSHCGAGFACVVQESPATAACGAAPGGACRITGPVRCARSRRARRKGLWRGVFGYLDPQAGQNLAIAVIFPCAGQREITMARLQRLIACQCIAHGKQARAPHVARVLAHALVSSRLETALPTPDAGAGTMHIKKAAEAAFWEWHENLN